MIGEYDVFIKGLPTNWSFDRLKDIASLRNEKTDEVSSEEDYLELEDMESGTGKILNRKNTLETVSAVTLFKKGDVLFGKLRPYLEKYYQADFDGRCTGEILAFKPDRIASRFLFYCIGSPWFISRCNAISYGAKMPRVSWPTQLSQFNIPLPPLSEQERIVAYLDAICMDIDAAVAVKQRQIDTLETLRKITIHNVVTHGLNPNVKMKSTGLNWLGEVPSHWLVSRIKNLAKLSPGFSGPAPNKDEMCTVVSMELLSEDGHINTSIEQAFEDISSGLTLFEVGDVLFAKITPCMENGKGAFVASLPTRYAFGSTEFHVLRPFPQVNGQYLYFYTHNVVFREYAAENMSGAAGQKRVSSRFLLDTRLFLPPIQEQMAIAIYLTDKLKKFNVLGAQLLHQIKTLLAYRKSLIHECVTGKRRITDEDVARIKQRTRGI